MAVSASMNTSTDTGGTTDPTSQGPENQAEANRKYHIQSVEMWLEFIGLVALIGVMIAVGFHLID
jgi:hypothetical protein